MESVRLALSLDDSSRYEGYCDGHIDGRAEGEKIGMEKGEKIGIEKGRANAMREMARMLKSMGKMTVEEIAAATGLSTDEISKL